MKANLKGLGGIKGLLLLHGEKVAMGVVGLLALWFIYSSVRLPRLEDNRQADDLQREIQQTNSVVADSKWPQPGSELADQVAVAEPVAKGDGDNRVQPGKYAVTAPLVPTWVASTERRTDPVLLNALEVNAVGGTGLFSFIDAKVQEARRLADAQRQQEEIRKQQEELERQQREQVQGRQGPYGEGIGRGYGEGGATTVYDPEHPKRRPVEGMARPAGVPLQGDERIERMHWAVVTAKVPIREQLRLYHDAFQNARGYDPARDFPRYIGYQVQRAEVERGKEPEWKLVPLYDGQKASVMNNSPINRAAVTMAAVSQLYKVVGTTWAGMVPDVVDPRFTDYVLTLPLPPLVGRDWVEDATHPDIPLAVNTPPLEEEVIPIEEEPTEQPADGDDMPNFRAGTPDQMGSPYGERGGRMGGGYGAYGGGERGGLGGEYGGRMGAYGGGERAYGGGRMGAYGGGRMGAYGAYPSRGGMDGEYGEGGGRSYAGAPSMGQRTTLPRGVDFLLLRFFDFSVEPGKRYKYRVRLVLADPNVGMEDRYLAADVLDRHAKEWAEEKARRGDKAVRRDYRMIETWSDPSRTVGIPLEGSVRLAEVKLPPQGKHNDEPAVKLLVESFDLDANGNAIQAAAERDLRRGYVANFVQKDQEYLGPGGVWIDTMESFNFHTGITLLDVQGGETVAKDNAAPARVLLMDPAGELHIRREMDDKPAVSYHRLLFQKDRRRGRGGEMETPYGNPYGGGERGRYGGGYPGGT